MSYMNYKQVAGNGRGLNPGHLRLDQFHVLDLDIPLLWWEVKPTYLVG